VAHGRPRRKSPGTATEIQPAADRTLQTNVNGPTKSKSFADSNRHAWTISQAALPLARHRTLPPRRSFTTAKEPELLVGNRGVIAGEWQGAA